MRTLLKNRRNLALLTILLLLLADGLMVSYLQTTSKYNNPAFKSYIEARTYCDHFLGGTHESKAQLYQDWKQSHGLIGC